jgi:hypothetical protein
MHAVSPHSPPHLTHAWGPAAGTLSRCQGLLPLAWSLGVRRHVSDSIALPAIPILIHHIWGARGASHHIIAWGIRGWLPYHWDPWSVLLFFFVSICLSARIVCTEHGETRRGDSPTHAWDGHWGLTEFYYHHTRPCLIGEAGPPRTARDGGVQCFWHLHTSSPPSSFITSSHI